MINTREDQQNLDLTEILTMSLFLFCFSVGAEKWPSGLRLKLTKGRNLSQTEILPVTQLNPGESVDISIPMVSPSELGIYESQWRLINSDGNYIGG